jgi:hypothetical protein
VEFLFNLVTITRFDGTLTLNSRLHPLDPAEIGSGVADPDEQLTLNAADDRLVL